MALSLPVRIQGQYPDGQPWEEMTTTSDASFGGTSLGLRRVVLRGQALHLNSVELDGKERLHVGAVVIEGGDISLLGQTYLGRLSNVQMRGDEMVLN